MGPSGHRQDHIAAPHHGPVARLTAAASKVWGDEVGPHVESRSCSSSAAAWACCSRTARCSTDEDVYENVAFPAARAYQASRAAGSASWCLTKLHAVGLRGAARLMPAELSGGMARRVALARAIVMDPDILIYDEPFVGLDPISMGVICRLIKQMNEALGITSIVVSHDVQELSSDCARQLPAVGRQGSGVRHAGRTRRAATCPR